MHKRRIQRCGVRQAVGNRATCRTGMPSGTRSVCSSPSRRNFTSKLRVPPVGAAIDIGATSAPCSKSSSGTTRKVGRTEHAMMSTPGSCTELAGGGVKRNRLSTEAQAGAYDPRSLRPPNAGYSARRDRASGQAPLPSRPPSAARAVRLRAALRLVRPRVYPEGAVYGTS